VYLVLIMVREHPMRSVIDKFVAPCLLLAASCAQLMTLEIRNASSETSFRPAVPRTWEDQAMAALEVPLANPIGSPKHVPTDYYYRIPVRPIYKSYPVYAPRHEPPGYMAGSGVRSRSSCGTIPATHLR
jgi:hypothetical protein